MFFRLMSLVIALLVFSMPVLAEQRLSDALFYSQLTNNPVPTTTYVIPQKDPWVAGALSFLVPGLGQIYNGQPVKGLAFFGGVIAGYTLFILAVEDNYYNYYGFYVDPEGDDDSGVLGLLTGFGLWVAAIVDAPISANRINRQNQARAIKLQSVPNGVGATLTFRW